MVQVRDDPIVRAMECRGYGPRYLTEEEPLSHGCAVPAPLGKGSLMKIGRMKEVERYGRLQKAVLG